MHAEPKLWESLVWVHGKSVWCFMLNRPMLSPWLQAVLDMGNRNWSGVGCTSGGVDLAVMQWQTHFRNLCAVYSWETPDGFLKAISQLVTRDSKMLSSFKTNSLPSLPPPTNSLSLRLKGTPPQRTHPCNKYFLLKLRRQMPITDTERECNDRRFCGIVMSSVWEGFFHSVFSIQLQRSTWSAIFLCDQEEEDVL